MGYPVKINFTDLIKKELRQNNNNDLSVLDLSIFDTGEAFDKYIADKIKFEGVSDEFIKEAVNGEAGAEEEETAETSERNETEIIDEDNIFTQNSDDELSKVDSDEISGENAQDTIKGAYKIFEILNSLDADGNGTADTSEKKKFEDFIEKSFDETTSTKELIDMMSELDAVQKLFSGKKFTDKEKKELLEKIKEEYKTEKLDNETLREALLDIMKGDFNDNSPLTKENSDSDNDKKDTKTNKTEDTQNTTTPTQTSAPVNSSNPTGGGTTTNYDGGNTVPTNDGGDVKPSDDLNELYSQRTTQESAVSSAKEAVNKAFSENEKNISDAQSDYDNKKSDFDSADEAYKSAIENDSYLSKENKELHENIKKNLTEISEAEQAKNEAQQNVSASEQEASTASMAVSEKQTNLNSAESRLNALKSAVESYDKQEGEGYNKAVEELNNAQTAYDDAKSALEDAKKQEEEAKKKLEENKTAFKDAEERLANAEKEKSELDKQLEAVAPKLDAATKTAKTNYDKAKEALDTAEQKVEEATTKQSEEVSKAQEALAAEQAKLDEINKTINIKEAEKTTNEFKQSADGINSELAQKIDAKLGAGFCEALSQMAKKINCDPEDLLGMMYSESGLNANIGGSGQATGLTQFLDVTAESVGTTCDAMVQMSATQQLTYISKFFELVKGWAGLSSDSRVDAGTLYAMNFLPAFANRDVLCSSGDIYYNSNYPLDIDGDGHITKSDLATRIERKKQEMYADFGVAYT